MGIQTKLAGCLRFIATTHAAIASTSSTLPLHSQALGYPQASQKIATLGSI
jgi:hypothetical protein